MNGFLYEGEDFLALFFFFFSFFPRKLHFWENCKTIKTKMGQRAEKALQIKAQIQKDIYL